MLAFINSVVFILFIIFFLINILSKDRKRGANAALIISGLFLFGCVIDALMGHIASAFIDLFCSMLWRWIWMKEIKILGDSNKEE